MKRRAFLAVLAATLAGAGVWKLLGRSRPSHAGPGRFRLETVASGLDHPWSFAFLPDGRMLVTEREGRLRVVSSDGALSDPVEGLPEVSAVGQGGLLDVVLHPQFSSNRLVYMSFAEPRDGGNATSVMRGTLSEDAQRIDRRRGDLPPAAGIQMAVITSARVWCSTGRVPCS